MYFAIGDLVVLHGEIGLILEIKPAGNLVIYWNNQPMRITDNWCRPLTENTILKGVN